MTWFKGEIDYAGQRLEKAVEHAADKFNSVVREGIEQAGGELRDVVIGAGHEVDAKLDKISAEIHDQRKFTKDDVRELVDYAAQKLGATIDERVAVMRVEIASLVQEKVEYLKSEVDLFFVRRQQDLARERRRLLINVLIAVSASFTVGIASLFYHRLFQGTLDLFGLFRILFISLTGGYGVYLTIRVIRRYMQMEEHRKDLVFMAYRYWGALRPGSLFMHLLVLALIAAVYLVLFFPDFLVSLLGNGDWLRWLRGVTGV